MPIDRSIKKVLVIGSGPIVIGQAAEFDYAGSQACRSLREEGISVVLVNSNPATIMTDVDMADSVYLEPITPEAVEEIIAKERPDGLLPTLGGQVGLNMAVELDRRGVLAEYGVRLLGTPVGSIQRAEDRELFKETMQELGEPVPGSGIVGSVEEALELAGRIGYPVIVRPGYTLGGTGGGFASNGEELSQIASKGLIYSMNRQLLIEASVAGWKEIEFEVIRDSADNCIVVCSMENVDPVGIHTGDSIVVAPTQTLSDRDYQMLRSSAIRIIRALKIEGGCNIQYALDPDSAAYYLIEVNPRVSRSSALASKATGYPIARVASKIALGLRLDEIVNGVTGNTSAMFEPVVDYVVAKVPRWPFDKFRGAGRKLGSQMKATGEVMALGRNFPAALLKAVRSLEAGFTGLLVPEMEKLSIPELMDKMGRGDDERIFAVAEALRRGVSIAQIHMATKIDVFFLDNIEHIVWLEGMLASKRKWTDEDWLKAKKCGFSDFQLSRLLNCTEDELRQQRLRRGLSACYHMVDTCAGEFDAKTPYFYSAYGERNEAFASDRRKVVVLGSGPIRIGQGVEFDYCSVQASLSLKDMGYESIIVNSNPETVSTDPDTSDRLYFEPLTLENVLDVIDNERPMGVMVQFGGQTAINLAEPLAAHGVEVLGTSVEDIDAAEDREKFDALLEELGLARPAGRMARTRAEAHGIAAELGFPVLVRPSYVLGGRAMEIVYNEKDLEDYLNEAVKVSNEHPVLVDRYLLGREVEVDAISDGREVLIPGIMEHQERAGVHSGDSTAIYPTINLTDAEKDEIVATTVRLARALKVKGLMNVQYVIHKGKLYIIEVNPRASRTVPFMSKVTGIPMVRLATAASLGKSLAELGYRGGLWKEAGVYAVKMPVFSFNKLTDVEISLGPEMKSTGEVIGIDEDYRMALRKAFLGAGYRIPDGGAILATLADKDKQEALPIIKGYADLGFSVWATTGTARFLRENSVPVSEVGKIGSPGKDVIALIRSGEVGLVINTPAKGKEPQKDGFRIRRAAVEFNLPCMTSLDTASGLLEVIRDMKKRGAGRGLGVKSLKEHVGAA
ncbi:MAG TPA: carbamoyl-phosphate synthase large subunit [Bacillota bacterium]|nr:carbamoyl-phosphate synthase large subunit [Bacillota bacterium]